MAAISEARRCGARHGRLGARATLVSARKSRRTERRRVSSRASGAWTRRCGPRCRLVAQRGAPRSREHPLRRSRTLAIFGGPGGCAGRLGGVARVRRPRAGARRRVPSCPLPLRRRPACPARAMRPPRECARRSPANGVPACGPTRTGRTRRAKGAPQGDIPTAVSDGTGKLLLLIPNPNRMFAARRSLLPRALRSLERRPIAQDSWADVLRWITPLTHASTWLMYMFCMYRHVFLSPCLHSATASAAPTL